MRKLSFLVSGRVAGLLVVALAVVATGGVEQVQAKGGFQQVMEKTIGEAGQGLSIGSTDRAYRNFYKTLKWLWTQDLTGSYSSGQSMSTSSASRLRALGSQAIQMRSTLMQELDPEFATALNQFYTTLKENIFAELEAKEVALKAGTYQPKTPLPFAEASTPQIQRYIEFKQEKDEKREIRRKRQSSVFSDVPVTEPNSVEKGLGTVTEERPDQLNREQGGAAVEVPVDPTLQGGAVVKGSGELVSDEVKRLKEEKDDADVPSGMLLPRVEVPQPSPGEALSGRGPWFTGREKVAIGALSAVLGLVLAADGYLVCHLKDGPCPLPKAQG